MTFDDVVEKRDAKRKHVREARLRAEARSLLDRLAERGVALRLEHGAIRWSSTGADDLTEADVRAIRQLAATIKRLLAEGGEP